MFLKGKLFTGQCHTYHRSQVESTTPLTIKPNP